MALTSFIRRTWERLFGKWWDGTPEPPVKKISVLVEAYYRRLEATDAAGKDFVRDFPPPQEWVVEFACQVWRHGFQSGYGWGDEQWERHFQGVDE